MDSLFKKKYLLIIMAGLTLAALFPGLPVMAEETSTDAEVEVLPEGNISYGFKVIDTSNVIQRHLALHAPDDKGAVILLNGWISIQLETKVAVSDKISVWAANQGWQRSNLKVYISEDGRKWKSVGQVKVDKHGFQRYDFTGNFKNVKYIKISRSGGIFSWLLLDAVGTKRG